MSVVVDLTELEASYDELYRKALAGAMQEDPLVKPVGLAESLKIRVITKGPGYTGFVLKPLQNFLWSTLRRHPAFTLIGKPVDHWLVQERLGARLRPGEAYLSGDYSAATDNLAPWVSECIANEISRLSGLTPDENELFIRALTRHVFVDEDGVRTTQEWGQLMGSVVSFPVLCIANAAMCRWSMELANKRFWTLADCSLLINGDDCLFRTTLPGLGFWKRITTFGGLTPSIGKFFFSRRFAQVNSANFVRRDRPEMRGFNGKLREGWFDTVKYVNLGLMLGLKRSGEVAEKADITGDSTRSSLGALSRELVNSAPAVLAHTLLMNFIKFNGKILKSTNIPWFVPEAFGGVGLPTVRGPDELALRPPRDGDNELVNYYVVRWPRASPSKLQLRVCRLLLEDPEKYPVGSLPGLGTWEMHKVAMSRLPIKTVLGTPTPDEASAWQRTYSALVVDTLFSSSLLMGKTDVVRERQLKVLKRNERSWDRAIRKASTAQRLSRSALWTVSPAKPYLLCTVLSTVAAEPLGAVLAPGFEDFEPIDDLDLWP
jgi:hypothetical protein